VGLSGLMRVTSGTVDLGNANNEDLTAGGGTLVVEGGELDIAGKYNASSTATTFSLTGGTINIFKQQFHQHIHCSLPYFGGRQLL